MDDQLFSAARIRLQGYNKRLHLTAGKTFSQILHGSLIKNSFYSIVAGGKNDFAGNRLSLKKSRLWKIQCPADLLQRSDRRR